MSVTSSHYFGVELVPLAKKKMRRGGMNGCQNKVGECRLL